jgi:hypothetical protein
VIAREPGVGIIGGMDEIETDGSAFDLALDHVLQSFLGSGGLRRADSEDGPENRFCP